MAGVVASPPFVAFRPPCLYWKHFWHMPGHNTLFTDTSCWQFIIIHNLLHPKPSSPCFQMMHFQFMRCLHFPSDFICLSFCIYADVPAAVHLRTSKLLQSEQVLLVITPVHVCILLWLIFFPSAKRAFFTTLHYCKSGMFNESGSLMGLNTSSLVTYLLVCQMCFSSLSSRFIYTVSVRPHVEVD